MTPITFIDLPTNVANASGTLIKNDQGWQEVTITFSLSGGGLSSGTDVVVVLDASFSMWAPFYRRPEKVVGLVEPVIDFMSPYDDDGIDVYLHSLKNAPFTHLGAFTSGEEVTGHIAEYAEALTAQRTMGQRTVCAPVIHDIVARLKQQKDSDRVFVEIITDGEFDDKEAVREAILTYGMTYNSDDNPFGLRFHFTGIGANGSKGVQFLEALDTQLGEDHPGYMDCVQTDHSSNVMENVRAMLRELQSAVKLDAENILVQVSGDDGSDPGYVSHAEGDWEEGPVLSLEALPVTLTVRALFPTLPREVRFSLSFTDGDDNTHELLIRASTTG